MCPTCPCARRMRRGGGTIAALQAKSLMDGPQTQPPATIVVRSESRNHDPADSTPGAQECPAHSQYAAAVTHSLACSHTQEGSQLRMEEDPSDSSHAQRIVKELYHRYQKQLQRWKDYRNLFFFLCFCALYLAILYVQRQANTAFKVHSTMSDVLVPQDKVMSSTDDVYNWLNGVLTVRSGHLSAARTAPAQSHSTSSVATIWVHSVETAHT